MAKTLVFEVKVNGIRSAVTGTGDLKEAIKATRRELDQTDFGSKKYQDLQKQLGSLKKLQKDVNADTREAGRQFEISADKGAESYRALNAELVSLRNRFKELSRAQREGATGDAFRKRIQQLDTELKDIDGSIGNFQRNVGNYQSALEGLGGINLAELATVPGAIIAVGTAAIQAGKFVFQLSERFRELRGTVKNFTDGSEAEIDEFTARVAALEDTFDATANEIAGAARNISDQFGIGFDEALTQIEEGFVAGSNANGDFLDLAREYAPVFNEIGASAEQAFAFINRTVTQGVYSDQGLAAIEEAQLRLRELPQSTLAALDAIGISGEEIQQAIGERGIAGAIADVSGRLGEFENDSREVGVVLADVFGAAGEKAGADFVKSLKDIEDATGGVIDETNEYQLAQQRTLEVNQEFARVQNEVSKRLSGTTEGFGNLSTVIQTKALQALLFIIDRLKKFWQATLPVREALIGLAEALGIVDNQGKVTQAALGALNTILETQEFLWNLASEAIGFVIDQITGLINKGRDVLEFFGILDDSAKNTQENIDAIADQIAQEDNIQNNLARQAEAQDKATGARKRAKRSLEETTAATKKAAEETKKLREETENAAVAADQFAQGSINALKQEVSGLREELANAAPEDQESILSGLVDAEQALEEAEEYQRLLREAISGERLEIPVTPRLEDIEGAAERPQFRAEVQEIPIDARLEAIEREKLARIEAAREGADTEEEFARQRGQIELEATRRALIERQKELERNSIEYLEIEQEIADTTAQINAEKVQALAEQEQQRAEQIRDIEQQIFGAISSTIDGLTRASQGRTEIEIDNLEARYQREIELAEGNEQEQEDLREELADKREQIERREFEKQKQFRVAAALTSLAEGVVNILSAPTTIPDPFGAIFKSVRIGILTATTAAQINQINRQRAAEGLLAENPQGTHIKASMGTMVGQAIRGATHNDPAGGVDIAANGQNILAEAGEFVDVDEYGGIAIVNKRSTAARRKELEQNAGRTFPGKRQFLSGINAHKNYGVTFAREGALARPNIEPILSSTTPAIGTANVTANAKFSDAQTATIAATIAERTGAEVRDAMSKGLLDTNRRIERERRLSDRTGRT